jgi:hypothetical protein
MLKVIHVNAMWLLQRMRFVNRLSVLCPAAINFQIYVIPVGPSVRGADHSPLSCAEVKNVELRLLSPLAPAWR